MAKKNSETVSEPIINSAPASVSDSPRRRRSGKGGFILFIALIGVSIYAYYLHNQNLDLKNPERQISRIVAGVSTHLMVPENETPVVAPINKSQNTEPFFEKAEDGDWLVIYRSINQAIIWSPKRDVLVNVGVLLPAQEDQPQAKKSADTTDDQASTTEEKI